MERVKEIGVGLFIGIIVLFFGSIYYFETNYQNKVYPGIMVGDLDAGGKTKEEIEEYFAKKSFPFSSLDIIFQYDDTVATISGETLAVAFDGKLSAEQAISLGRSGHFIGDTVRKIISIRHGIRLPVVLYYNTEELDNFLLSLSESINIEPQDALFNFEGGRVTAFKPSKDGRKLDVEKTRELFSEYVRSLTSYENIDKNTLTIPLPVYEVFPAITTEDSNKYGIKELIGRGESRFLHSIPSRIHNITLAASRVNGKLISPGEEFSFNNAVGDISAATGFQPAYIIKSGKTVLGDGGGVCQVSTTFFRAALNAGLPITQRYAHAYRVGYYEQDSPPGLDATIYAPTYDLKIVNNTGNYILIQAKTDVANAKLTFDFYGTKDGRTAEISKPRVYAQTPPPEDLYQDDPTLPAGTIKQTDFKAWGAKVDFNYRVMKDEEVIYEKTFFSNYRPWQAVFLRGTQT
ncbi:VanW family protein [Candidatus Gottesmanbacteria bacterium]|nr:VanW family protein [Candidatus Gottesmanbacteria bacterium]